ncbi:MAG: glycosyltransferase, partial [Candidatus Omnitrophica bacterium]|nr:glycosyltransferase [Candidatus Omnitrophota bacterium]
FLRERYGAPAGAIRVVLNGIAWNPPPPPALDAAAQAFRRHWGVSDRGPVIGTVARLVSAKEFPVLLEAFHQLRGTVPSAQLVIVGDGPDKPAIIRRAYALGEQDHVVITGAVSMTAIPLAVMDLFVLSSSNEAFGLAVVEAMAMGRPVVASRVGGIPDVVDDGVTGVLVPPRDPGALARALQRLVDDPEAARAMGRAGRARYERQFTMERVAREVEQVYEEVARG